MASILFSGLCANAEALKCENNGDQRELEIVSENGGCKLNYTKNGTASMVANQKAGDEKCKEIFDRIKGKLETSGYTCK